MIYLEEVRDISSAQEPIVAKIVVGLCARYGRMELPVFRYVQKSHPQICINETVITVTAAMAQNMDLLRKLRDDGCHWDHRTTLYAAMLGNLEMLQYAHINGCEWNEEVCCYATLKEHMNTLQYAHSNGYP